MSTDKDRERANQWYQDNKEKHLKYMRERPPEILMLISAKTRCKKQNIPFNLTTEDVVIPDVCPVFKTPFVRGTLSAPSLDRLNAELGYVKGNINVISRRANTIKNNGTAEEHRLIADWIDSFTEASC